MLHEIFTFYRLHKIYILLHKYRISLEQRSKYCRKFAFAAQNFTVIRIMPFFLPPK
jgi:hypothetical protein